MWLCVRVRVYYIACVYCACVLYTHTLYNTHTHTHTHTHTLVVAQCRPCIDLSIHLPICIMHVYTNTQTSRTIAEPCRCTAPRWQLCAPGAWARRRSERLHAPSAHTCPQPSSSATAARSEARASFFFVVRPRRMLGRARIGRARNYCCVG